MGRILVLYVLPAAAPALLYLAWTAWRAKKGLPPPARKPWPWLALAGVALCAASLFLHDLTERGDPGVRYEAPHLEDGKVVPGKVKP